MKSSADYNLVRARLKKEGKYAPRKKIVELNLFWLENVGYESVLEKLWEFEGKHKKNHPQDNTLRFFAGIPKCAEFQGIKISSEKLIKCGDFGIYVLPCEEASRDVENPTRNYIW